MLAIAIALSSSVCWGVSDFVGGIQARRLSLLNLMLLSQAIGCACLIVLVAARGSAPPHLVRLLPAVAAGIGGVAGLAAFYRALAIGTMSIVAPISATGVTVPVVVGIASGDRPAALQIAGILAAVAGVALASRERSAGSERQIARASLGLALLAALGFGGYFVGMRSSARADVLWALLAARGAGVIALLLVIGVRREAVGAGRDALGALVAIGVLDLAANGLYAIASRHGALSEVAVAASLYPVATVLLARALLGERVRRVQEVGILAAIAGVILIAAG
ncbi:MAG: DMT family transporter [Actinomycetota bacterium]|nr:DMT family transporter [Actinomycetota bacterium]